MIGKINTQKWHFLPDDRIGPMGALSGSFGPCLATVMKMHIFRGGRRQKSFGGALCSNDDVIIVMTSLLLQSPAKILVGL